MRFTAAALAGAVLVASAIALAAEGVPAKGKQKATEAGCVGCHGPDGVSIAENIPHLAGQPDLFVQFQLVYFRNGTRKNEIMNPMAQPLSDEDVRNLGAYFASLPPAKLPLPADSAPDDTHLGEKVAQAVHCTNCHGDHFEGVDNIPRLAGQREEYLNKALHDFKSAVRTSSGVGAMADVMYPLGDTEMKALSHYLSRLR